MAQPSVIASRIRRRGFRKWYEAELIRGHSHLVLLILCALGVLGALEALSDGTGADRALLALSLLLAGGIGIWAMRRYLFLLLRAETVANQAVCPACEVYARWTIEDESGAATEPVLRVRCRACQHGWKIDC